MSMWVRNSDNKLFDNDYRELDEDDLTTLERLGVIPTV